MPELTVTGVVIHFHFPVCMCSSTAAACTACSQRVTRNVQAQGNGSKDDICTDIAAAA